MCEPRCNEHCYEGDEYGRVRFLEKQNRELREELTDAKREVSALHDELRKPEVVEKHPWWAQYQPHRAYLLAKIQRQAEAIRKLQKVGWQPSTIIREVPYPDDAHLWLGDDELRTDGYPKKQRVQNRYPARK